MSEPLKNPELEQSSTQPQFVSRRDLTKEDVMKLNTMTVHLLHQKSKKGFSSFYLLFVVDPQYMTIKQQITEPQYQNFRLALNLPIMDKQNHAIDDNPITVWYRFVTGPISDGRKYKSIEFIFDKNLSYRYFFENKKDNPILSNLEIIEKKYSALPVDHIRKSFFSWEQQDAVISQADIDAFTPKFSQEE